MDEDREQKSGPSFRIWLCGAFRVERRIGESYEVVRTAEWGGSSYPRLLLKGLLCCPGRQARREALIEMLWPAVDPEQSSAYLNTATTKLRKVLQSAKGQESLLLTEDDCQLYLLAGQKQMWVEVDEAFTLLNEAEHLGRTSPEALPLLELAADYLGRGILLEEEGGTWLAGRRATVDRTRYRCRIWLSEVYTHQNRLGQAEMVLNALLEDDPFDEDVLCRLMVLLHRQGLVRQSLLLYEQACRAFSSEGLELTESARELAAQLHESHRYTLYTPTNSTAFHGTIPPLRYVDSENTFLSQFTTAIAQGIVLAATELGKEEIPMTNQLRRDLAKFLGLSPILGILTRSGYTIRINELDSETNATYEEDLKLSWHLYYSSSAQAAAGTIDRRIRHLSSQLEYASGQARQALLAFKCRFLQLDAVVARDRLDLSRSLQQNEEAIALATYLDNAELLAASLFRRARTHLNMQNYDLAIQDLERARPYADRSRDPLKSYVFICLAEAYSLGFPNDLQIQKEALALLDEVGKTLRNSKDGQMEGDGSFTKVDVPGWAMERANVLGRFGQLALAREALYEAHQELGPPWTRWQGNLEIADAGISLLENDLERCCTRLRKAAMIVRSIHSRSNASKIKNIYEKLTETFPANIRIQDLGAELDQPLLA